MLFFGKKSADLDLSWLHADMHSHLIPGIDDGAPDMAASLELIKGLQKLGYKKLVTTPHILWEVYPNTADIIAKGLEGLKGAMAEEGISMELQAAAEYFIDEYFEENLKAKEPLLPISGNKVLVEFSMITAPMDLQQVLFQLQIQGYIPVIAHPERYIYLAQRKQTFDELKEAGCLFQLNLLSLTGYYGKSVQELAEYLCKKNYYSLAGTDLHNPRHLAALQKLSSSATFSRLKESGLLLNSTL
ncbi:tyrosine-protein phosphatase [Flavisolibacter ginsenosidimutans]|uniref:protein-tyrosine-phosphatase n=1 Tax=Flavisolibacter ginsenosidimutans TaxID=661481 RepID=A0A5B8UJ91_9BACT|nr:CpsB/CapC family capsule biosynthesis tyrosine phosphatase [Flavisolibacter ginsenosidimutans]QEC56466.1 capsular biosynthesis protein [Flavisolibacter ginsenosidimutans]